MPLHPGSGLALLPPRGGGFEGEIGGNLGENVGNRFLEKLLFFRGFLGFLKVFQGFFRVFNFSYFVIKTGGEFFVSCVFLLFFSLFHVFSGFSISLL